MADVHGTQRLGSAPRIAIGAAIAALLMSMLAVIVVASRGGPAPGAGAGGAPGEPKEGEPADRVQRVAAADVVRLRREAVTPVREAGKPIGVKVTDDELRKALDLGPDDVITAIAGRAIEREHDVFEVMLAMKRLRPSTLFVEILRDGRPVLARWKVDGDLQTARAPDADDPRGPLGGLGIYGGVGSSALGGGGVGLGGLGSTPMNDPLADTVKKLDDLSYEVPRATIERVLASRSSYARVARTLPSRRTAGFLVYGVRPGTLVAAIGIVNGDTIRAINGNAVSSIDEAIDLYPQIKDAGEWRIDVVRRSKPVLITISIK